MSKRPWVTAEQILLHMIGDYIIQSDYMAQEKTKSSLPAFWHALSYTLPFLAVTRKPKALGIIGVTHFLIDRFRLARYVCWGKNQLAPKKFRYTWKDGDKMGYKNSSPPFLGFWLLIIADNVLHILINGQALRGRRREINERVCGGCRRTRRPWRNNTK